MKKIFSIAAMIVLMSGCGGSSGSSTGKAVTLDEVKNIVKLSSKVDKTVKSVSSKSKKEIDQSKSKGSKSTRAITDENASREDCTNGGYMMIKMDDEFIQKIKDIQNGQIPTEPITFKMTVSANNCDDGEFVENGEMMISTTMDITDPEPDTMKMEFTTDYSVNNENTSFVVKRGSSIVEKPNSEYTQSVMNMEVTGEEDGVPHSLIMQDYTINEKENGDGTFVEFPSSGKISIDGSSSLTVDPSSSQTPTIYGSNGDILQSGIAKYTDEAGHRVEIEEGEEKITIWVDENGNGQKDEGEIEVLE